MVSTTKTVYHGGETKTTGNAQVRLFIRHYSNTKTAFVTKQTFGGTLTNNGQTAKQKKTRQPAN